MTDPIEAAILDQLAALPAGKSISPDDVAKALQPEQWQRMTGKVRGVAVGMARQGRIIITKKGKPMDPNAFKGVIRLRLPIEGEAPPVPAEPADDEI